MKEEFTCPRCTVYTVEVCTIDHFLFETSPGDCGQRTGIEMGLTSCVVNDISVTFQSPNLCVCECECVCAWG